MTGVGAAFYSFYKAFNKFLKDFFYLTADARRQKTLSFFLATFCIVFAMGKRQFLKEIATIDGIFACENDILPL